MNTLFNNALRQSNAIRKDLTSMTDAPGAASPASQGQFNASLATFSRTIDEYNQLAKQELVPAKQEKAFERVKNFRADLTDFREQFELVKKEREETTARNARTELLGRRPHNTATPENPYANATIAQNSPFRPANADGQSAFGTAPQEFTRETHALREQGFFAQSNSQLDEFLDRGRAVLGDLGHQREMLKGTQKKLYSIGTTLGISGDTIRMVERRAKQDKWIFWTGVAVFFVFCFLVLRWLR